jgi:hypothetical protein
MFTPKSLLVIDPGLSNEIGHNITQDLAIVRECHRRSIPVALYSCIGSNISTQDGIRSIEIFSVDIFAEKHPPNPELAAFENYFYINEIFFQELKKIQSVDFTQDDVLYFPNILQNQLEGLGEWLSCLPEINRPRVAITLRYLNFEMAYNTTRGYGSAIKLLYSYTLPKLMERHPNVHLFTDTEELTRRYTELSRSRVVTLPIPQSEAQSQQQVALSTVSSDEVSILYIGGWAQYHGSDYIPYIIIQILNACPNVKFTVQVRAEPGTRDYHVMYSLVQAYGNRLRVLFGKLSASEYEDALSSADMVLLLYMPSHYSFASSGVFTEAAARGKVIVTTAGTTMESSIQSYGLSAVIAPSFTAQGCSEAVKIAVDNIAQLRLTAQETHPSFAWDNSPAGFLSTMFDHISEWHGQ